jgi:DNA-binding transcriptional LysR family regulator
LGAAFVPVVSIDRELAAGTIHRPQVADLQVKRQLKLITHPARYCSRASAAFRQDVLPVFASPDSPIRQKGATPVVPHLSADQLAQN